MKKKINNLAKGTIALLVFVTTLFLSMEKNKNGEWNFAFSQVTAHNLAFSGSGSGSGGSGSGGSGSGGSGSGSGSAAWGPWVEEGETEGEDVSSGGNDGTECPTCVKDMMLKYKKCSKEWARYDSDGKKVKAGFTTGQKLICKSKTGAYCNQTSQKACDAVAPTGD